MDRAEKHALVEQLNATFKETAVVVVTKNHGLTVAEVTDLRGRMREAGADYKVAKNRLAKIALKDTTYEPVSDLLVGPTALATSSDPVAAAKAAADFAKEHEKLEIVGGAMGDTALDAAAVKQLAALPSLDELRAKIIGLTQAPATKIAQIAAAPAGQLARVFGAYAAKEDA
ncbi:MAG: 50S ribosomal protein L10 [Pacificimonas sp.]